MFFWSFQQPGETVVQQKDVECVKEIVKLGGIVKNVVLFYILANVIPGTMLTMCTKTSPEDMYEFSYFLVT
jgi:hypothetical protein